MIQQECLYCLAALPQGNATGFCDNRCRHGYALELACREAQHESRPSPYLQSVISSVLPS